MEHLTATESSTALGRYLRPREAAAAMGVSVSSFWRMAQQPDFPALVKLSPRCTRVREEELAAFMRLRTGASKPAEHA